MHRISKSVSLLVLATAVSVCAFAGTASAQLGQPVIGNMGVGPSGSYALVSFEADGRGRHRVVCVSPTDSVTGIQGYVDIADSMKFSTSSAKVVQSKWAQVGAQLGDGVGGVVFNAAPEPLENCAISWTVKDDDGDGDYNGGSDEMKATLSCDPAELLTLGMTQAQADAIVAQLGGAGCTIEGAPVQLP